MCVCVCERERERERESHRAIGKCIIRFVMCDNLACRKVTCRSSQDYLCVIHVQMVCICSLCGVTNVHYDTTF